mmetsp:Transcript_1826/g.5755  ORF Transcript_1826/g.5755 Transcript_1826/m.5755 type:complete len:247 (+) Transcript_1826:290-1030(+)
MRSVGGPLRPPVPGVERQGADVRHQGAVRCRQQPRPGDVEDEGVESPSVHPAQPAVGVARMQPTGKEDHDEDEFDGLEAEPLPPVVQRVHVAASPDVRARHHEPRQEDRPVAAHRPGDARPELERPALVHHPADKQHRVQGWMPKLLHRHDGGVQHPHGQHDPDHPAAVAAPEQTREQGPEHHGRAFADVPRHVAEVCQSTGPRSVPEEGVAREDASGQEGHGDETNDAAKRRPGSKTQARLPRRR